MYTRLTIYMHPHPQKYIQNIQDAHTHVATHKYQQIQLLILLLIAMCLFATLVGSQWSQSYHFHKIWFKMLVIPNCAIWFVFVELWPQLIIMSQSKSLCGEIGFQ